MSQDGLDSDCPVCREKKRSYQFVVRGLPVCRCPGCGLLSLYPQPSKKDAAEFGVRYGGKVAGEPQAWLVDTETEREASRQYLDMLRNRGVRSGRLLLIALDGHPFAEQARLQGFEIARHVSVDEFQAAEARDAHYDAAVVCHQLEKAADVTEFMNRIKAALRPGGVLLLTMPSVESWPRNFLGSQWAEWRPENLYYFEPVSIQGLLLRSGFHKVWVEADRRRYTLRHIYQRAKSIPRSLMTRLIILLFNITPPPFRDMRLRFSCSGMVVAAQKAAEPMRPVCSIVVPVYNEKDTFETVLQELLAKELPGLEKEIIVVESNSTDGTRELVRKYEHHLQVRTIFEARARGKGHAVRTGLKHATGVIVLIQDADTEYDIRDYDALLEPVANFRAAFVLGARHGGRWKMREFQQDKIAADILNLGHKFFTFVLNFLYRQNMCDPFTMYKIFWRDCLYGLEFHCNRFDFDHELVIKLVRKGYTPLEIPVNYRSRSFREGKKIRLILDPLSWIWVDFKLRFVRVRKTPIETLPQ